MQQNPDIYLFYEYMKKTSFTVRVKVRLDEAVDVQLLTETAREAFSRFPYNVVGEVF